MTAPDPIAEVFVSGRSGSVRGTLRAGGRSVECALGRAGVVVEKQEGDGGTPTGRFPLRRVLYRPDRGAAPRTGLPVEAITPDQGWCDDPHRPEYNRPVALPFSGGHERLWREDGLYDIVVVLGHNDDPPRPGAGSAVFLHLRDPEGKPTEGCVAVTRPELEALLAQCGPETVIDIRVEET